MHALELIGLAGSIAAHGRAMLAAGETPSTHAIQDYWLCSRFRHENWCHRLAEHRRAVQEYGTSYRTRRWHEVHPIIQEVFLSEPLTRVVAYLARLIEDASDEPEEIASVAANALSMHVETRHRCLHLMVFGQGIPADVAVQLNGLRRCVEDLNDRLLAFLPRVDGVDGFCFDTPNLDDMQREWLTKGDSQLQNEWTTGGNLGSLPMLHMRLVELNWMGQVASDVDARAANPRLNRRISQSAIGLLPPKMFDSFGVAAAKEQWKKFEPVMDFDGKSDDLLRPLAPPLDMLTPKLSRLRDAKQPDSRWKT